MLLEDIWKLEDPTLLAKSNTDYDPNREYKFHIRLDNITLPNLPNDGRHGLLSHYIKHGNEWDSLKEGYTTLLEDIKELIQKWPTLQIVNDDDEVISKKYITSVLVIRTLDLFNDLNTNNKRMPDGSYWCEHPFFEAIHDYVLPCMQKWHHFVLTKRQTLLKTGIHIQTQNNNIILFDPTDYTIIPTIGGEIALSCYRLYDKTKDKKEDLYKWLQYMNDTKKIYAINIVKDSKLVSQIKTPSDIQLKNFANSINK